MKHNTRNRAKIKDIADALNLYFNGLSLRNTTKALSRFVYRSHITIKDGIQKYKPMRLFYRKTNVDGFIVDETQIQVGSECIWLRIAIEPKDKEILSITISKKRNRFVAERFLSNLLEEYSNYSVSTDGGDSILKLAGSENNVSYSFFF